MDYKNAGLPIESRVEALLSLMTLEEKAAQLDIIRGVEYSTKVHTAYHCAIDDNASCNLTKFSNDFCNRGIGFIHDSYCIPSIANQFQKYLVEHTRLGIPCIFTGEALHGVLFPSASIFPVPICMGASFNPDIVNKIGSAIAAETRSLGIEEILAPNLDVARELRWGRVEETFGEDTYLSSELGYSIITGEQQNSDISRSDAVICEPKHYCVHGIPEVGLNCAPARVGIREIEQNYLPVFEKAIVYAGANNVMASYNCIDSEPVVTSKHYLTDILRERYHLNGYVRADWGAVGRIVSCHATAGTDKDAICNAFNAGMDMQGCCDYSFDFWEKTLVELVNEGRISMSAIDNSVRNVLRLKFKLGLFEQPYTDEKNYKNVLRCDKHKAVSLECAKQGITLLKNNGILPISDSVKSIALLGPSSAVQRLGGYSSVPFGYSVKSVLDEMKELTGGKVKISQCSACGITSNEGIVEIDGQPHLTKVSDTAVEENIEEAVKLASESDVVIIVGGDNTFTSSEGFDRTDLRLPGKQKNLIAEVAKLGKPLILVLENGKPVDLSAESEFTDAILVSWFGGEFGAKAIVETLFGKNNPAGRLPVSFPSGTTRIPCYYSMLPNTVHTSFEGECFPMYPFGFGLSYTKFEYSNLQINKKSDTEYDVSVSVKNTGKVNGDEVIQLYVNDKVSSVITPKLQLKAFKRINLNPDESKTVTFHLDDSSFKLMNTSYRWVIEKGKFEILVGAASNDIRLKGEIFIDKEKKFESNLFFSKG
jgi:beta-glucosidase